MPMAHRLVPIQSGKEEDAMNRLLSPTALIAGLAGVALAFYSVRKSEDHEGAARAFRHVS